MDSTDSYVRKTCKSCLEDITIHITCSKCDATYHIYCVKNVPGAYVDLQGQLFCCPNITSNYGSSQNILRTQEDLVEVVIKKESLDDCEEDVENYRPKQETSEWNMFKSDVHSSEVTNKEHLEDCYGECSIKSEGLIQELRIKDEELENCLHKEEDLEQNEFKCSACLLEFINKQHLDNHYKECPNKQIEFLQESYEHKAGLVCSFCNEEDFQNEPYEQHIKRCEEYHSGLNNVKDIRITSMEWTNKQLLKCNKCGYATKRRHLLKYHILSKHNKGKKPSSYLEYILQTHSNQKRFKCNRCDYHTALKGSLNTHMKVKHSSTAKEYTCGECKYSTYKKWNLVNHIRIHTKERPLKCGSCDYATVRKDNLERHTRSHTNDRPFKCDTCDYAVTSKEGLNYHILIKHSNAEKKFKCSDCKYSTHVKSHLVEHTRIHTKEKPFKCDTCDYASASRCCLNRHILAKHSDPEKMYKCSDCKYFTNQKSSLVRHTRIHTNEKPFKCHTCDYAAASRTGLSRHILAKHSDAEDMYKCSECKYSTNLKSNLVRHTRIHSKEKPFKRDTCDYAATSRAGLNTKHSDGAAIATIPLT